MNINLHHEKAMADVYGVESPFYGLLQGLAREFKAAREEQGLSQRELAARMNTSQAQVVRMEHGETFAVTLRSIFAQADALGYTLCIDLEER